MKPKDVSSELVRIASEIDSSREPSAGAVAVDLRRVLAALAGDVVVTGSSHKGFEKDEKADGIWTTEVTYVGTAAGAPFKLVGTVSVQAEVEADEDEDGRHAGVTVLGPDFEGASSAEVGGAPADPDGEEVLAILESDGFRKADAAYMGLLNKEFESDIAPDVMSEWADAASYARDPYAYFGVKRSDFM